MTREEAYDAVAKIAAEHALIAQGFGGVLTIVHPDTQRQEGIEAHCLYVAGQGEHPDAERQRQQIAEQAAARRAEAQLDIFNDSKESVA
jgi:hypothetical protein